MGRSDWYRRTTWTESDQTEFFARLNRSRSPSAKAQYLRIQAVYLQEAGTKEMIRASITLLDKLLEEYPDAFDLASVYLQKAECLLALGDETGAIHYFRKSLQREREFPNVRTTAALRFGWMIVERRLSNFYDEALLAIEHYVGINNVLVFPFERYIVNAIRAVITEERGCPDVARELAQAALDAASQKHSDFRYHPTVGLVQSTNSPIHTRLIQMTGG